MSFHLDCFGITDVGRVRSSNQDQFLIADLKPALAVRQASIVDDKAETILGKDCLKLLVIADGIGGQPGGQRASELVVQSIVEYMLKNLPAVCSGDAEDVSSIRELLIHAVGFCETELARVIRQSPEFQDMGTTLTTACIIGQELFVVHVGDSRCYLWRNGRLRQLTLDHTLAQKLVDGGELTKEQADRSPWNHILWNAVSGDDQVCHPELHHARLREHDALLLCTDGLTRHVSDDRIAALLSAGHGTEVACQALVKDAIQAGGTDNVTVIMATDNSQRTDPPSTAAMICSA